MTRYRRMSMLTMSLAMLLSVGVAGVSAQEKPAAGEGELRGEPLIALSPYQVFEQRSPAVVRVVSQDERGAVVVASATGFFVAADGLVVTDASVARDAKFIRLQLKDKSVAFADRVLAIDDATGLALLKANVKDAPVIELGDAKLQKGDPVYAIGNSTSVAQTFSEGTLKTLGESGSAIETTASVSASSAGAPFLDYMGKLVGVAIAPADANVLKVTRARPASHVAALLKLPRAEAPDLASAGRDVIAAPKPERDRPDPVVANPDQPDPNNPVQHEGQVAPKAPPIPGYTSVGFDTLKKYRYDPLEPQEIREGKKPREQPVPEEVANLAGKKVAVMGYMIPVDFEDGGTNEFILVSVVPGCFFCQQPQLNDWIEVKTVGGKRFPYPGDDMIIVTGAFAVGPVYDGEFIRSIYRIDADNLKLAK